jgi:hypothetical protein
MTFRKWRTKWSGPNLTGPLRFGSVRELAER